MPERVCALIDGSNFYHACRSQIGRTDIRLGDFARWLVGPERALIRTYYYNCPLPPDAPEEVASFQGHLADELAQAADVARLLTAADLRAFLAR